MPEEVKKFPFIVRTEQGVRHTGCDDEGAAKFVAEHLNAEAKKLGIKTRYEVLAVAPD